MAAAAAAAASSSSAAAEPDAPNSDAPPCDPKTRARWYQLEALERALRGNTVVFLETGAGKTLIAVLLLRAYAHRIRRGPGPAPGPRSFAVFLVPTVVLVGQQARVIEAHTDLRVDQFYGEMGVDFWSAAAWRDVVDRAEVLVMTPQILLRNLLHRFFRLRDIALLIFDECHHAKGNHPYACILKEFYHPERNSGESVPRIFGMTASPVSSKASNRDDYSKQISKLENLMDSKVYTVENDSALSEYISFAAPKIVQYDDSSIPSELHELVIISLDGLKTKHLELFEAKLHGSSLESAKQRISSLHMTFLYCIVNLGVWLAAKAAEVLSRNECCLSFWGVKLNEQAEGFIRNYSEDVYKDLSHFSKRDNIGEDFDADLRDGLLTSKVLFLIKSLLVYRHMQDLRCIVFVERVITCIVLQSLLSSIKHMSGWNIKYMAGNKNGYHSQSRTKHMEIVDSFRSGKVHLIIATDILEEGLDVPSCNLVVRFDPSATVRSFIQSRGRARMQNSDYVLLVRRGDVEALSKAEKFLYSGQMMREESLRLAPAICQPLENTLCDDEYYRVESTGALVTLNSSVPLIYFFCSKLPSDEYFKPLPRFVTDKASGTCTLHLPKSSPVQTIHAEGEGSVLKQVVCLKACRELHAVGALTDNLLPELGVPYEDEHDIVMETYKQDQPDYFPEQLLDSWCSFSHRGLYYCYKISLKGCLGKAISSADIVLAVKCDMGSDFADNSFKLWGVHGDVNVTINFMDISHLTEEQVIIARGFQTSILSLLIGNGHSEVSDSNKYFREMQESIGVVYLLLPLVSGKVDWCCIKFSASPAYDATAKDMRHCHSCKNIDLLQTIDGPICRCMLKNSVVCTPHNNMIYAVSDFLELNANSLLNRNDGSVVSYKTHFNTRYGLNITYEDQPLLFATKLLKARNFLHKYHYKKEKEYSSMRGVELPPELCKVVMSPISEDTLCSFLFIPSIMYRIQCMLLSVKLKFQLGPTMHQFDIQPLKILEALTTKECQEEFSQESLETLGDSFLKYVTTQHLFGKYRLYHEGILTKMKKNLISNAALCQLACSNKLVGYIRGRAFSPEAWIIPGLGYDSCGNSKIVCVSHNMYSLSNLLSIKSKRIADSVEALIGAYLSAVGEEAAFLFLKSLGMDIDFHSEMTVERRITGNCEEFINMRSLETMLGYNFGDPSLLLEALTHGSYQIAGSAACYQRLEFLGDAVLDHIFTEYFFNQYPECTPGLLTDLRSASVNNNCYAHAAVKAGLHKHILHSSLDLQRGMAFYLEKFEQSFSGPSHGWEAGIGLPKVLGDVIESIAGAIYIDSKHNKEAVWRSMKRLFEPLAAPETLEHDPVRELQELCDRKFYSVSYTKTHKNGVSSVVAEVQAEGITYAATRTGLSKFVAKKLAAKDVLQDIKDAER